MRARTLLVGGLFALGCGGGSTAKIRMIPNVIAGTATSASAQSGGLTAQKSAISVGSPSAMDLKSLKYYINSIQLCQDVTASGSGYSNAQGCIELYQNMDSSSPDYSTYDATQAMADTTPGRYVDLMTAEGQATIRKPVTLAVQVAPEGDAGSDGGASQVGAYRYGLINFYRPIKVTAEFPVLGQPGQYYRTRAVNQVVDTTPTGSMFNSEEVLIGDTTSGPTEETTYMLNNGGALFTFQKPFAVTQADVDANAEIKVDLVFNPENFGQAYQMDTNAQHCQASQYASICDPTNNVVIDMPYVRMNPVPRKSGETTHKETYLMDYEDGAKLRIELYYNDADVEAGVQGVDAAVVYDATATMPHNNVIASNYVSQTGSVQTSDASITLMDYQHTPNLEMLRRQNGTATIHCLYAGSLCPSVGGTTTRAYTYAGDTVVSVD